MGYGLRTVILHGPASAGLRQLVANAAHWHTAAHYPGQFYALQIRRSVAATVQSASRYLATSGARLGLKSSSGLPVPTVPSPHEQKEKLLPKANTLLVIYRLS